MLYAEGSLTTIKGTMKVLVLGSSPKVMGRVATPTRVIASLVMITRASSWSGYSLSDSKVISGDDSRGFLIYRKVATTYEVFNLVLQIVALLGVVFIVTVEVAASAVPFLGSSSYRVGGFDESFLLDLEEDLSPGGVERNVGELGNSLLGSLRPLTWEPRRWAPRGLSPQALLIFALLFH
ncbi:hypothetical protein BHM03_00034278 [Ensete ventricosum]|nr:hypothetical protein BHM03_00034278 [Ensete ventricosum]